jgi:hypothetical protein
MQVIGDEMVVFCGKWGWLWLGAGTALQRASAICFPAGVPGESDGRFPVKAIRFSGLNTFYYDERREITCKLGEKFFWRVGPRKADRRRTGLRWVGELFGGGAG